MPRSIAAALLLVALAACGSKEESKPPAPAPGAGSAEPPPLFDDRPPPPPADPATEARQLFASTCATCHGARGGADGAMAARLTPPPRDHGDPAWQDSVTDQQIAAIIVGGGASAGKSPSMPANPDLARKPEVLAELVALIRSFRR